jgi:hypothetical protein
MSDFYQILRRESETKTENHQDDSGKIFNGKIDDAKAVEKLPFKKKTFPPKKKIKKTVPEESIKKSRIKKESGEEKTEVEKKIKVDEFKRAILAEEPEHPVWLTMSETAKLGGVKKRTVKRALRAGLIKYRIVEKRYQINLRSAVLFFHSRKKLWNKLENFGFGQYVKFWN